MIIWCNMTTYVGSPTVWWAEHYHARMKGPGREEETLRYYPTAEEVRRLNKDNRDDIIDDVTTGTFFKASSDMYSVDESTSQFFSEEKLKAEAIAQYKDMFPGAAILVYGDKCVLEPQPILDGPPELITLVAEMVEICEEFDWWEGDELLMDFMSRKHETIMAHFNTDPDHYYDTVSKPYKPSKKGPKAKPYGIEMFLDVPFLPKEWHTWKWYKTEKQRDQALADLNKSVNTYLRGKEKFRKVDR